MDSKLKYLRIGRMGKRKRELRGNKHLILKGRMRLKKYKRRKTVSEEEEELNNVNEVNNPTEISELKVDGSQNVLSSVKLGKHGRNNTMEIPDKSNKIITEPVPPSSSCATAKDMKESVCLMTQSSFFHGRMITKDCSPGFDEYLDSSLQIQHKLMRSNTLLTKLTSIVNNLGSRIRRVEEDYFHLELKYQHALDKMTSVEAELQFCQSQFHGMKYNLALKEKEVSSLQSQLDELKLNMIVKDQQIFELHQLGEHMSLREDQKVKQNENQESLSAPCQTLLTKEDVIVMEEQLNELVSCKKENNEILENTKRLEESLAIKTLYVAELQTKLNELSLENENVTSAMERIIVELGKIDADVEGWINKNKCSALYISNFFARKNTRSLKTLLARENLVYVKKVEQVKALERDLCCYQTKLLHQQLENQGLEKCLDGNKSLSLI